jgi:hypothetical protein
MAEVNTPKGWVPTEQDVVARRLAARRLVGLRMASVHYLNIDYRGWDLGFREPALREVANGAEWERPPWNGAGFHSIEFGVEIRTSDNQVFSVSWDPPGEAESLRISASALTGEVTSGAIWDVSAVPPWDACVGRPVTDVVLHYHPWSGSEPGYWCSRATIVVDYERVDVLLGDWAPNGRELGPAANNIAVLLDSDAVPDFELKYEDV